MGRRDAGGEHEHRDDGRAEGRGQPEVVTGGGGSHQAARPTDPVNGIVTSKTAASAAPLRRRRRCSAAPGSTWQLGYRTRTTPPTPAPRPGQERTPPRTGAR